MEKKQTAVKWLINEHFGCIENCTPDFRNKIQQALEKEKQQIVKAYGNQLKKSRGVSNYEYWMSGEEYYNETFKSE